MRAGIPILGALLILGWGGCAYSDRGNPSNIAELKRIGSASPEAARLMKVTGTVTFADYQSGFFVLQDNTGGLRVPLSKGHFLAGEGVGRSVEVWGRFPDAASGIFQESSVTILGGKPMPPALPVHISDARLGEKLDRRVSLDGVVKSAISLRPGLAAFVLVSDAVEVPVKAILIGANEIESFVNANVRVTGVLLNQTKNGRSRLEVWSPDIHDVRVLHPAAPAPAAVASRPLPAIRTALEVHELSAAMAALHYPVELTAVVTYFDPQPNIFFVQDKTDGMYVQLKPGSIPRFAPVTW